MRLHEFSLRLESAKLQGRCSWRSILYVVSFFLNAKQHQLQRFLLLSNPSSLQHDFTIGDQGQVCEQPQQKIWGRSFFQFSVVE